jgi:preprotein translocase subunit YajC
MSFISQAFAQVSEVPAVPAEPSALANMIPLALVFIIFYFLIIRPQQKKFKEHAQLVANIKKGDEVITGGGIYAKVKKIENDILHLEIADGVNIRATKSSVSAVTKEDEKK